MDRYEEIHETISQIHHPNVEHINEVQNHTENLFLISRHQARTSLADQIQSGLTLKDALNIIIQAAHGLSAAHNSDIVHGSMELNSLSSIPNREIVVSDFGEYALAKGVPSQIRNLQKLPYVNYLAPELTDEREPTIASDVFSLGAILYETVTGRAPFSGDNAQTVFLHQRENGILLPTVRNKELPGNIENILVKALQLEPENRYHTAAEMASSITSALDTLKMEELSQRVPPNNIHFHHIKLMIDH